MKKALTYIKSLDFAFILCLLAMTGQSFHTFYSFYSVSNIESDWFRIPESIILVVVFELFTLFYLMRGRQRLAMFYSFCLFVMNVYYYASTGSEGAKLYLGIFLSLIIPISVYFVSEEVKKEYTKEPDRDRLDDLEKLVAEIDKKQKRKSLIL